MPDPSPESLGAFNWLLIIALGVIWGSAFMSVAIALTGYPPIWTAALRVSIGALAIVAAGGVLGQPLSAIARTPRGWHYTIAIGLITATIPMLLLTWGIQHVPSAFAGIAMGAVPLLILPLAFVFSPDEGIGPRRIAGVTLGFVGLAILVGPGAFGTGHALAQLACVGAACCYAIGSITTRRAPKMPPLAFAGGTLLVGSLAMLPLAWAIEGPPALAPLRPTLALIYLGLFPTGLAALIRLRVITTAGSVFMSQTSYMVPIWSAVFGVALMGETLPPSIFAALALILTGIAISQSRKRP